MGRSGVTTLLDPSRPRGGPQPPSALPRVTAWMRPMFSTPTVLTMLSCLLSLFLGTGHNCAFIRGVGSGRITKRKVAA